MRSSRLLSLERVAALIEVSEKTVRRWWAEGDFIAPVYLPNGQPRWNSILVEMWMNSRPSVAPEKKNFEGQGGTGRDREGQIPDPPKSPKRPA